MVDPLRYFSFQPVLHDIWFPLSFSRVYLIQIVKFASSLEVCNVKEIPIHLVN